MSSNWLFYKLPKDIAKRVDISSSAKIVLTVLIDRIGQNDFCWPGIRCLAKDCGINRNTVIRAVKDLEAKNLIQVKRARKKSNNYFCANWHNFQARWYQNDTSAGTKNSPDLAQKLGHNKTDPLNKTQLNIYTQTESSRSKSRQFGYSKPRYNRDYASQKSSFGTVIEM